MATLAEVKGHAARLFAQAQPLHALRLYDAIVAAAPLDYESRLKVADCLSALGELPMSAEVYRSVGWYALKSGHPLVALVAARVLQSIGFESGDLNASLVVHYGRDSELLGRVAARINLPDDATAIAAPDLRTAPGPTESLAAAARRAATCTDGFDEFPDALHAIPLLSALSEDAFRRVLATLLVRRLPHGELVIREGEPGQSFFFVACGEVRVFATDGLGRQTELARLHEGAVFGEMALLSAQPRSASVEVIGEADLLEVTRESLAALAGELAAVADALHAFTRERLLNNLMATSALFKPFNRAQQRDLLRRFTSHDVAPGTAIINEGDEGQGLFVLVAGEAEVERQGTSGAVTLATLRAGEVFGEMSLLRGGPTTASVLATRPATVLFLAREYVTRIVTGVPEIKRYLEALAEDRDLDNQLVADFDAFPDEDERVLI
jgi:CRP-like cAMP-binding protein